MFHAPRFMKNWKDYNIKLPQSRTQKQEFGKAQKPILSCKICDIVYYKKSWHHNLEHYQKLKEDQGVDFAICPACQMIKNKQFEGKLIIKNIPVKFVKEITNLIQSFSQRAFERDPLDRLIKIQQTSNQLIATFTENQLAVKLAKKIKAAFNKVKTEIKYSPSPSDITEAVVSFTDHVACNT